jgi:TatD DNase family protein
MHLAEAVMELGFYISFTGVITFKNAKMAEVAREAPLDRIMVETDCPYMAPVPHRGKRNEPSYVQHVAQKLAELKNLPFARVAEATTANARHLFSLKNI